jgi:hypothetical protein
MKKKLSEKFSGENNPFYGRSHNQDSVDKIKQKNEIYRELNKEKILNDRLQRLNIDKQKIQAAFIEYCNTRKNADDIQNDLNIDKRVFFKYVELFEIASKEEIQNIKDKKRLSQAKSSPEQKLYNIFCEMYGEDKVKWGHNINSYFYDFFIDKTLLVEYDGYYWHTIRESKNDKKKDELAKRLNIPLYRVKEDEKRKCNLKQEAEKIHEVLCEIRASKRRNKKI